MSGVGLQTIVMGALYRPSQAEIHHKKERKLDDTGSKLDYLKTLFDIELFRSSSFMLMIISILFWNICYAVVLLHIANFSVEMGSTKAQAAMLLFWIGLGSVISRVISGLLIKKVNILITNFVCLAFITITVGVFPLYAFSDTQRVIFSSLFGILTGGLQALAVPICIEIIGLRLMTSALGLMWFGIGLGTITGPSIAGDVFSYNFE